MKRFLSIVLSLALAIPIISIPTLSHALTFPDVRGHWAEDVIYRAVSYGIVSGDAAGTFRPNAPVTRAEFTTMVNNTLGNKELTSITFTDVPYYAWYHDHVAKGVAASFINGYTNNTFAPNAYIQRQEAAAVLDRIIPYEGYSSISSAIKDKSTISSWAIESVSKLYNKGYMKGDEKGRFNPTKALTRAEAAKILCDVYENENIVTADTSIKTSRTTVRNKIYANDVTITSAVGSGDVDIENCVILGTLNVYGGGTNTVTISNSRVSNANISKSSSAVRVLLTDRTVLNRTTVSKKAILETDDLLGGLHGIGFNHVNVKGSSDLTLRGSFGTVNVNGSSVDLELEGSNIDTLNVSSSGKYAEIDMDSSSDINVANLFARCDFTGYGLVQTMNVHTNNVTFETEPRYVNVTSGYKSPNGGDYGFGYDYGIEIDPEHKQDDVDTHTDITLYFPTKITKYNGANLTGSDIESLIHLRKGSSTGARVPFTATISKTKKVVHIMPDRELADDTKYYVVIPANSVIDINGNANEAQTTYFSTGSLASSGDDDDEDDVADEKVDKITFYPADDAEGASVTVHPTITFPYPIEQYSGGDVTSAYLEKYLILREGGSGGTKIDFTASLSSSRRTITIKPTDNLNHNMNYYLSLPVKRFRSKDDNSLVPATSVTWKTGGAAAPTVSITPNTGSSGVPIDTQITIQFSAAVYPGPGGSLSENYIQNNILFTNNTAKASVDYYVLSYNKGTIVLKPSLPLDAGSSFTVVVPANKFKNNTGAYAPAITTTFTTVYNLKGMPELQTAIKNAKNEMNNGIQTSAIAGNDIFDDVQWVSEDAWNKLQEAVETGEYLLKHGKTELEISNAITNLTTKTEAFRNSIAHGKKPTNVAAVQKLDEYIIDCKELLDQTVYSPDGKDIAQDRLWVPSKDLISDFKAAIQTAKDIRASKFRADQTDSICSDAYIALLEISLEFSDATALGTKPNTTDLLEAIVNATELLSVPTLSHDGGLKNQLGKDIEDGTQWTEYENYTTFKAAIATATNAKSAATQEEINQALAALLKATETFEAAIKIKGAEASGNSGSESGNQVTPPAEGEGSGNSGN